MIDIAIGSAAASFLKTPFDEIFKTSSSQLKKFWEHWKNAGAIDDLIAKTSGLGMVRTISSRQLIDLDSIYYASKIKIKNTELQPKFLDQALSLSNSNSLIITGTVGQGKSIFIRYLAIREIREAKGLPIFIELRHAEKNKDLLRLIELQLAYLGFGDNAGDDLLNQLFSRKLVALFLDGFDEIKREIAQDIVDSIQKLSVKYPHLRIVISSRPTELSNHLDRLIGFPRAEILPLSPKDFQAFFERIGVEQEVRTRLLNAIQNSTSAVKSLITTPLMLTLVANSCSNRANLPDNLPDFFEALFGVMVAMHDESKPGYVRERATSFSNSQFQEFFQAFCFVAKEKCDALSLTSAQISECATKSSKITQYQCRSEDFLRDIVDVACLMVKDGINHAFIHKSIREYFSASFIKNIDDDLVAGKLYSAAIKNTSDWNQELKFLEQIDPFRFKRFFTIPCIDACLNAFDFNPNSSVGARKDKILKIINSLDPSSLPGMSGKARWACSSRALQKIGAGWTPFEIVEAFDKILENKGFQQYSQMPVNDPTQEEIIAITRGKLKDLYATRIRIDKELQDRNATLLKLVGIH